MVSDILVDYKNNESDVGEFAVKDKQEEHQKFSPSNDSDYCNSVNLKCTNSEYSGTEFRDSGLNFNNIN